MTSRVSIPADGSTRLFTVPFPFLNQSHVVFYVNRVIKFVPSDVKWVGPNAVEFVSDPQGVVEIVRQTPIEPLVTFHNGSTLTEAELNTAVDQALYALEEIRDQYTALINGSLDAVAGQAGITSDPQSVLDVLTQEILNSALLADLQQRIADIDLNALTINAQRIRLDTVEDTIAALTNVDGQSIATFLLDEQQARIEGDTAIANELHLIGAKSSDSQSFIFDLNKVKVSPTESLGVRLSGLLTQINEAKAQVLSEQTARVSADSAITTSITQANSRIGAAEALIASEQTTRASADSAATSRMDGMQSSINGNAAAIVTEQQTRASADSSMASSISTLQSTTGAHSASISTIQTVQNGLTAQYMVKTDVNGYLSGFGLYNNGATSQFIVLADRFAVVTPGRTPQVPFVVGNVAGAPVVGINGTLVVDGSIAARSLSVNQLSAISADMGTINAGKITLASNGRALILEGGGTYPLWYGVGTFANEENAIFYAKNDGSLFFKGSLRNSNFDMRSTVISTGGGREAPFVIFDQSNAGSATGGTTLTCSFAALYSPDYGSGYTRTRVAHRKVDVMLFANASGAGNVGQTTGIHFEVQYDDGAWTRFGTNIFDTYGNSSESLAMRYTLRDDFAWSWARFRVVSGGVTHALTATLQVYNFAPSAFNSGSASNPNTGEPTGIPTGGGGGGSPGGEGGGWCVVPDCWITPTTRIEAVQDGETYRTFSPTSGVERYAVAAVGPLKMQPCVLLKTTSGAGIKVSRDTPFNLQTAKSDLDPGHWLPANEMLNQWVLVEADGYLDWERVIYCEDIGLWPVRPISFGGRSFPAGINPDRRIYSHNMAKPNI